MNYTEEQLKKALVRALPDELVVSNGAIYWMPPDPMFSASRVTLYEWPAIVGMVEDKLMTEEQYLKFDSELEHEGWRHNQTLAGVLRFKQHPFNRAQALADIGAITVKEGA